MTKRIAIFDFDGTMVHSPSQEVGQPMWEKAKKMHWYSVNKGWWGAAESLNLDVFDIPVNGWVHKRYVETKSCDETKTYLVTGRLKKLEKQVLDVCTKHGLEFEDVYCNTGGDTLRFKMRLFEKLIEDHPNLEEFVMFDDRHEHLQEFVSWAKKQKVKVSIIDVINKKQLY